MRLLISYLTFMPVLTYTRINNNDDTGGFRGFVLVPIFVRMGDLILTPRRDKITLRWKLLWKVIGLE